MAQLVRYRVEVVADVRSVPYSRAFRDYNRETLIGHLRQAGIRYVYLGAELGPRSPEPEHYDADGQVQFDRLMASAPFAEGIARLRDGLRKPFTIALMCAEKDPANCHRSLLIGYALRREYGLELQHIDHGGGLEPQASLERRLMAITEIMPDMLCSEEDCLPMAYEQQLRAVAYRRK